MRISAQESVLTESPGGACSHSVHCAVAAFFSDHLFLVTAAVGHVITNHNMSSASLCHSMWFHKPFRADEWLLHHMVRPRRLPRRTAQTHFPVEARLQACSKEVIVDANST